MADPLIGARLKIERARKHLDLLRQETRVFTEGKPYRIRAEFDAERSEYAIRIRLREPGTRVPLGLSLIVGDAVHNLRSALDHLAWQLAIIGTGPGRSTQFPLMDEQEDYRDNEDRLLQGVVKRHRAVIDALQPYHVKAAVKRGLAPALLSPRFDKNLLLMLVGRLDNMDKHRLLLAGVPVVPFRQPILEGVDYAEGTRSADWVLMEEGAELYRITKWRLSPGVTEVRVKTPHSFTITFGDPTGEPAEVWDDRTKGAASGADLGLATDAVQSVIDSFAREFDQPVTRW